MSTKNDGFSTTPRVFHWPTWAGVALDFPDWPIYAQKTAFLESKRQLSSVFDFFLLRAEPGLSKAGPTFNPGEWETLLV